MKHFEDLWTESESMENDSDEESIILELSNKIELLKINNEILNEEVFGEVLYTLTKLSKIKNVNVYKALRKAIVKRLVVNP